MHEIESLIFLLAAAALLAQLARVLKVPYPILLVLGGLVMGFVGPVSELSGRWIRPHDVEILTEPTEGASEAQVDRIVHLGFEVRVELSLGDGDSTWAQTTRTRVEELELAEGQIVWLRLESAPVSV